ncbi:MAG: hypothetical protein COX77_04590 [Candidatus Komeilibacteria bacterium CG_4_10_14_0_2_um_filter_37_10]|uniref:Uncharacterized protein n=1 Tax=Candidatus Komeilibacteria bacterium CG_4_10_14_0_2_um_filter_37_10 TaxID=1974470 RepID=A0A2M7VD90_9BACT|nr:MAG: hypothetical protein COX77_04590 [Candidatus Komeilibacteria bacterium CG_4_10_14_0_2_um_filter_37_10]PJA94124.1 MAG: hypothetical protein CO133_00615 [Candidatus Komeilibacteria bacterium CG_4_9_14_3_um_filter_37_5]
MKNFVEIQNFGFNSITITALMTMIFTILQGVGITQQGKKIWQEKSARSLSPELFFLLLFYFLSFFFYGWSKDSLAMCFNSLLGLLYIPIIVGIYKFQTLSLIKKIIFFLTSLIVPMMIILQEKDIFLLVLLLISLLVLITQPLAMLKEKSRGSVDLNYILIFFVTSVFWLVYSMIINNWPLEIFNSLAIIVYLWILWLYHQYQ